MFPPPSSLVHLFTVPVFPSCFPVFFSWFLVLLWFVLHTGFCSWITLVLLSACSFNTIVSQPTCAVRQRHTGSQKCITCLVNSYISFSGLRKLKAKPTILCTMQASLTTTCKHAYMLHPRSFFFFPLTMHTGHLLACI